MQALVEERRSPALIRSSASLGQLSSPDSLPPSPSLSQLSFAGSLAGSVSYERRANRLPTLDPEHLHRMSKRKLRANAEVLHADVVAEPVFVRWSDIDASGLRTVVDDQAVTFTLDVDADGPIARGVRPVP